MIGKYHCFKTQAIAAVIETGRVMFGRRNWKFHTENQQLFDLDTAPDKKSIRRAEGAIQALSLSCIVKGGESSSQFRWFTIAKIELYFLICFFLILRLRLQRYSTNTKRCPPEKSLWKL